MDERTIGFALCGSYCTFDKALRTLAELSEMYDNIVPIMSEKAYSTDTRFGKARDFIDEIEALCGRSIIHTIAQAEPIGPKNLLDLLVIAPCTGNTLAKLAHGITDSSVTMAAKAHLRNGKPLLIAVSTNDGLTGNAANLGLLLNRKNVYFVPFGQDDPHKKPGSLIADFRLIPQAVESAFNGVQIQPVLRFDIG
ncbi:MAG TPA: dipicolinate synthase subunit B [Papillibacter sp.]|jgi:dipicolinate synthase subunit B|nr:dipicolinate synthase subunit B [Papillibacter sp.]